MSKDLSNYRDKYLKGELIENSLPNNPLDLFSNWFSELENPIEFLFQEGGASSVMDACYRYARHQRGADTVLFGTGNLEHLEKNLASILAPSLPEDCLNKIDEYFGHLEGVGLDFPGKK